MSAVNMVTVCHPPATGSRCSHAKWLPGKPQPGSCGQPCLAPVDQTGKRHRLRDLNCPLTELPPILITELGNRFFIFTFFRTFKIENRQYPFYRPTIGQTGALYALKMPSFFSRVYAPHPCDQGCKRTTASCALLVQRSEIC